MTTIRSVVAATDFSPASDAAVRRASHLAATHGAALCLVHAFDVGVWHSLKNVFDAQRLTVEPPPDVRMQQRLTDCAASLAASTGREVGVHFGLGPPAKVIEAYVNAHGSSLVVIGSRAEPTVSGLGSTALKVVRKPACPVLIVRVAEDRPYETVLSAVDLRAGSVRAASLAVALFPSAHHHLLYALDAESGSAAWDNLGREPLRLLQASLYSQAEHDLQQLAQSLSAATRHPLSATVADDVPARAILVGAANLAADCVVVGHHGLGTATESHLGSMAQHVIYAALADVLVVP
ncbi:MAG: universal stress protein [Rubrivivax sp.]|nr:universal stress protein [Rubrivivax sp.]